MKTNNSESRKAVNIRKKKSLLKLKINDFEIDLQIKQVNQTEKCNKNFLKSLMKTILNAI